MCITLTDLGDDLQRSRGVSRILTAIGLNNSPREAEASGFLKAFEEVEDVPGEGLHDNVAADENLSHNQTAMHL